MTSYLYQYVYKQTLVSMENGSNDEKLEYFFFIYSYKKRFYAYSFIPDQFLELDDDILVTIIFRLKYLIHVISYFRIGKKYEALYYFFLYKFLHLNLNMVHSSQNNLS